MLIQRHNIYLLELSSSDVWEFSIFTLDYLKNLEFQWHELVTFMKQWQYQRSNTKPLYNEFSHSIIRPHKLVFNILSVKELLVPKDHTWLFPRLRNMWPRRTREQEVSRFKSSALAIFNVSRKNLLQLNNDGATWMIPVQKLSQNTIYSNMSNYTSLYWCLYKLGKHKVNEDKLRVCNKCHAAQWPMWHRTRRFSITLIATVKWRIVSYNCFIQSYSFFMILMKRH